MFLGAISNNELGPIYFEARIDKSRMGNVPELFILIYRLLGSIIYDKFFLS